MKKSILSMALLAVVSVSTLSGCAGMMRTGEGVIRAMTPSNAGILTTAGNFAADTHKKVRGDVLGDNTVLDSDPAKQKQ